MSIEISSNGISKTYRFYPQDALYVDANGNVNTSGNGRQVTEAWANGVKYYPDVETCPKGTTKRVVVAGGFEGSVPIRSIRMLTSDGYYDEVFDLVNVVRRENGSRVGNAAPLSERDVKFSFQYEGVLSNSRNISYEEVQITPEMNLSNRAMWQGELYQARDFSNWQQGLYGILNDTNGSFVLIRDLEYYHLENIAIKVNFSDVFYDDLFFYCTMRDSYTTIDGIEYYMRGGHRHKNVSFASWEYSGNLPNPNRLVIDEQFDNDSIEIGFHSSGGSDEAFTTLMWHVIDLNEISIASTSNVYTAHCGMDFKVYHDRVYNIADDSDYVPHF